MLSFSRTAGYAILALGCIGSRKGDWVLSRHVHECTGIPMPYLRKILFALGKAGLIRAKRGYQGGFVLARPPEKITFLEIVRAVEGGKTTQDCLLALPRCTEANACPLRRFWQKERARIETQLDRITLAKASRFVQTAWVGEQSTCPAPGRVPKRRRRNQTTGPARRSRTPGAATRRKAPGAARGRKKAVRFRRRSMRAVHPRA